MLVQNYSTPDVLMLIAVGEKKNTTLIYEFLLIIPECKLITRLLNPEYDKLGKNF